MGVVSFGLATPVMHAPLDRRGKDFPTCTGYTFSGSSTPFLPCLPQSGPYSEYAVSLSGPPKIKAICCLASLQSRHLRHVLWPLSFLPLPSLSWDNLPPAPSTSHKKPILSSLFETSVTLETGAFQLGQSSLHGPRPLAPRLPGVLPSDPSPRAGFPSVAKV